MLGRIVSVWTSTKVIARIENSLITISTSIFPMAAQLDTVMSSYRPF